MKKSGKNAITANQLTAFISGSMIGLGILTMPKDLVAVSNQDAWISAALGILYPLYIVTIGIFLFKKHPDKNLIKLSKMYFGKFIGSFFNILLMLQFIVLLSSLCAGLIDVLRIYIVSFVSPKKLVVALCFLGLYAAIKGLKILARVNLITFFLMIILVLGSIAVLKEGSILNVMPILGSGFKKIILGSSKSAFSYYGSELLLLIYPFIAERDRDKLPRAAFLGVIITGIIYTWYVFCNIFYIGIDIIPKYTWPLLTVTEALTFAIISNFRYIFMFLWSMIIVKTISNLYFSFILVLNDLITIKNTKILYYITFPILVVLTNYFTDETLRRAITGKLLSKFLPFNIISLFILVLLVYLKKGDSRERS